MSERAQALEAAKVVSGWIDRQTVARDASDYSKGWRVGAQQAVEEFRAALAVEAPPVGGPQPTFDEELDAAVRRVWTEFGNDLGAFERAVKDSLSSRGVQRRAPTSLAPVEPTPEPPQRLVAQIDRCKERAHRDAIRLANALSLNGTGQQHARDVIERAMVFALVLPSVEPAPSAPCVWREETETALRQPGCRRPEELETEWEQFTAEEMNKWRGCPYCLKPIEITR